MTLAPLPPEDRDAIAAEYVVGLLPLPERLAAERRLAEDPAFAAAVADWERRLAPLNAAYPEVAPPDGLLERTEARLFPQPPRRSLLNRLARGWLAGAGTAAVLVLGALVVLPPPAPPLLATLGAEADSLRFELRHDGRQLLATRVAGLAPGTGQAHELWVIAPGAAPVSLGLLPETGALAVEYPVPPAGWTLAVSLEPAGGSPTGAPTGPVLAAAEITG